MKKKKTTLILVLLFLSVLLSEAAAETRFFVAKHRPAVELFPKVQAMLSKDGRATLEEPTNTIIVNDAPAVLREIERLLEKIDSPRTGVKLRVQSLSTSILESTGVAVNWKRIDGNWRLGDLSDSAKGDRTYDAGGKSVIVHSSADASERLYRVDAGETTQVVMGGRVRADRMKAGLFKGRPFVTDLETAEVQSALLVTPVVADNRVMLTIVPAVLSYQRGAVKVHRLDDLKITATCPNAGQIVLGTNDANGQALLSGLLAGMDGPAGGFSLLMRVDLE